MRRPGFTLLELLLAMAMSAIIAGSLATTLFVAYRARNAAERTIDASHTTDAISDVLKRDLANAMPPTPNPDDHLVLSGPFQGDTSHVDFYCSGLESKADVQGGCRWIELALASDPKDASRQILVRRVCTNLLAPMKQDPTEERICSNVSAFTLRYYDGTSWYDMWDSADHADALPVAVEVTISLLPNANSSQPTEMVRIVRIPCGVAGGAS
jgi:prepilin-type N-terminal cleavage/methylation domain-containing protein